MWQRESLWQRSAWKDSQGKKYNATDATAQNVGIHRYPTHALVPKHNLTHAPSASGLWSHLPNMALLKQSFGSSRTQLQEFSAAPVIILALVLLLCIPAAYWGFGTLVGTLARAGLETFDTDILGVDVDAESIVFDTLSGVLKVDNLVVYNPAGFETTPYMIKAGKVVLDINTCALTSSCFKHIDVELCQFTDVEIQVEANSQGTNIKKMLSHLEQKEQRPDTGKKQGSNISLNMSSRTLQRAQRTCSLLRHSKDAVELHRVIVHNVFVRFTGNVMGQHPSMNLEVGDLNWDDFSSQAGVHKTADIVAVLMKGILKSVLSNIAGRSNTSKVLSKATNPFQACC
jgi:hypothetical protein